MFAEEADDDDMFAEAPMKPKSAEGKTAQALDARLMDNWDDVEGYYITILGELIEDRYHVMQNLGKGMFSSVVRATDKRTGKAVAIKIVRNNESMRKAGVKEIDILRDLGANDPDDKKHVIRLERSFDHKGHLCMVFENLSMNLREVLKKFGRDVGINIKAIRTYAQQLFLGLSLLKKCQYIHADLKPDNILVNEARSTLKICDLGSASPITENATAPYLVSRFYRAPEVILGISYDYGIDMWSIGCTLFELYTGKILFTGRNNNGMLRAIMECRGKFPHKLLRRGALTYTYFDDLLNFQLQETDKATGRIVTKMIDVKPKPVRDLRSRLMPKDKKFSEQERKELESFVDLLDKCLDLRPEKRISPNDALRHPFIARTKP
jgi:serine/threonine-protein kinase PRP4